MPSIYTRFSELYQRECDRNKDRRLSPEETTVFGTLDCLIFFEFMEKYTREIFDYSVHNYINPQDGKLTEVDLPKSAHFFRGTSATYCTSSLRYQLNPSHDTSWSYSPYEAANWLAKQNNPAGAGIILVADFGKLIRKGKVRQIGGGVFSLNVHQEGLLTPLRILKPNPENAKAYVLKDFQKIDSLH